MEQNAESKDISESDPNDVSALRPWPIPVGSVMARYVVACGCVFAGDARSVSRRVSDHMRECDMCPGCGGNVVQRCIWETETALDNFESMHTEYAKHLASHQCRQKM